MGTAFVFPGQGSQYEGMGKELYERYEIARRLYDEASEVLGYDLIKACENKRDELDSTIIVQPAILVHSVVCWHVVQSWGEQKPECLAGHSLGELSAVVCAQGLSFSKAVELVKLRATLMSECVDDGGMMVVFGLGEKEIRSVCESVSTETHSVEVANHNTREQWVLSGHRRALVQAAERLEDQHGVTKMLQVSVPAHSKLMQPAREAFEKAVKSSNPAKCQYPIVSCATGEVYQEADVIPNLLSMQLTECVNWPMVMEKLTHQGVQNFIELGPKQVLRDVIRLEFPQVRALSFGGPEDEGLVQRILQGNNQRADETVSKNEMLLLLQACLRVAVGTPLKKAKSTVSFEQTIRAPYRRLVTQLNALREGREEPSLSQLRQAAEQTFRLLRAKGLGKEESLKLFRQALSNRSIELKLPEYFPS
ncbi:ACP S-malonyltransferase [Melghirimyces algeriensis]|uniref:[acyl-carrier-protein] S-malonyltransferase n=1 Tax=Melghirimyces algeriensis TaxID=910412 RepID=A0A521ABB3_9BACL|nr:ACP S-malonyltransferase [Melghirimyces algeriensis]SMO32078.1 [acyl-carrier-protein] S-malonyltransferase [Melghirimyces algeriensis]